ncbi:uncharacterized membrane protein YcaP (DUF421 family) [Kushneria sinocarnis]|uniref:Uncharacterized membrane protein YcaP (DUF421 family) n=1 Tax=Kushneria sinocarnis TaxID=595502 RepID=A0A420WZ62_9GAMM|nr:YetF domain-containing protein [Kushneria sinocarnis]RKR06570.1 uncharacterized membrane protein YcaP (DUF421 family) [Kushneria sinocarnis]
MQPVGHVLVVGILTYVALIVVLRLSGKRTLSKWNAFDFIVTIALGSVLATALMSTRVSLLQSIVALVVLVLLQFAITFTSVRSPVMRRLIKAEPALLLEAGGYRHDVMHRERVVEAEIRAAIREKGIADVESVAAVVLETDGSFSVIPRPGTTHSALNDVHPAPALKEAEEPTHRAN